MQKQTKRNRRYSITINHGVQNAETFFDPQRFEEYLQLRYKLDSELLYACWSYEEAPTTGHLHMHIMLVFKNGHACDAVKKSFPGAHVTPHHDAPSDLKDYIAKYCTPANPLYELGDWDIVKGIKNPAQKSTEKRSTDERIRELVAKYNTVEECMQDSPAFTQRNMEALKCLFAQKKHEAFLSKCDKLLVTNPDGSTDEIIIVKRNVFYIQLAQGMDILVDIRLRFGNDISFLNGSSSGEVKFDNYHETETMVLNLDTMNLSDKTFGLLVSEECLFLPARYQDKHNMARNIICTSRQPVCDIRFATAEAFTGGIWTAYKTNGVKYIKCLQKGDTDIIPVSLERIHIQE